MTNWNLSTRSLLTNIAASLAVAIALAGSTSAEALQGTANAPLNHQPISNAQTQGTKGQLQGGQFDRRAPLPRRLVVRASMKRPRQDPYEERSSILAQADRLVVVDDGVMACVVPKPASDRSLSSDSDIDHRGEEHVCIFFGFDDDPGSDGSSRD